MNKERMKTAVVGAGKMGLVHASILNTFPEVELVAFCDKSSLIRKFLVSMLGKNRVFADLEEALDLDVDIVYVTTPIPTHYSIIKETLSRKKSANIFVEKTLASNYGDSTRLVDLVQDLRIKNMVGYMKRFGVTFQKTRELLAQKALGEVSSFEAHAYSSDFFGIEAASKKSLSRGGVLSDLGSHVIDLAVWFFGDLEVQSNEDPKSTGIQDTVNFKVKNGENVEGTFDVSWCREGYHVPEFGLCIHGQKGKITVDDDVVALDTSTSGSTVWYRHDLNDSAGFLLGAPEYYREDHYFVKSTFGDVSGENNFISASKVDYVIQKVIGGAS